MEDTKGKYLNPKADLTFKKIFGEHEDLVMSLLNALLPLDEGKQIEHVKYLTPEMVPENPGKKNSVVDVRCQETGGRVFIVEMQMRSNLFACYQMGRKNWNNEFQQRVILNASKAVIKQLKTSEDYSLLQPVYALNLINDVGFDAGPDEFYHDYAIVNVAHTDRIIEGLRFIFVELPKFKSQTIKEKKMAVLWLRFLTEIDSDTETVPQELLENPDTSKALKILEKSAYNEEDMRAYEYYWDAVYNERGAIRHGYKQGMERGLADGLAQGMEKGQAKEKAETVLRLSKMGLTTHQIALGTDLTDEEVISIVSTYS